MWAFTKIASQCGLLRGMTILNAWQLAVWIEEFLIRVVVAYGPQLGDDADKKQNFWGFIEQQAVIAQKAGACFILQMVSNTHLGTDIIH